jgi:SPX domain protein involved in polyphosphate accumulation
MFAVENVIAVAINEEMNAAEKLHGLYQSREEQYTVVLEELIEAQEELEAAWEAINSLFDAIRHNNDTAASAAALEVSEAAERLACEAVQLAGVARKGFYI